MLGFFVGFEAGAIQVAIPAVPRAGGLILRLGFRLGARASTAYPVAPVRLLAKLHGGEAPQSAVCRPCLPLCLKEAIGVLHVGWEGCELRISSFDASSRAIDLRERTTTRKARCGARRGWPRDYRRKDDRQPTDPRSTGARSRETPRATSRAPTFYVQGRWLAVGIRRSRSSWAKAGLLAST